MVHSVILYGSGNCCKRLCKILKQSDIRILAILDSDPNKWGNEVQGYKIEKPKKIREFENEYVCIAVADTETIKEIRKSLQQIYSYTSDKEIHYNRLILEAYKQSQMLKRYINGKMIKNRSREEKSILLDCYNGLGLGGVEAWTMDLCKALIKNGKEETYIISDNGKYNISHSMEKHVIYTDIDHTEPFSITSIWNLVDVIIKKSPCKVITCMTDEVMLAAYIVKRYYPEQIQIVSVIHNSNEKIYEQYADFRECPDMYIGVSQDIRSNMIRQGIKSDIVFSMTCPFTCEETLERIYSEDACMPIHIGYAGRMEDFQKRMDLLQKLIEILVTENICFVMEIAGDGSARKRMEEFVLSHHLEERIQLLGKIDRAEISSFWKRQDICINLADFEGRSISIIEAMGNGVIPVVTATSGVKEDIIDGVNGYIVPLEDFHTAAYKIKYLSMNRNQLKKMGKKAHDMVYPKSLMESHLKFWKKILE